MGEWPADRSAKAFVWSVWAVMLLVAIIFIVQDGRRFPLTEDWLMVPALTGHEVNVPGWLWSQVNEHRVPFPKLVLLFLLNASHGDFRVGMVVIVMLLGLLSVAMIQTARLLREGVTRHVDAFFPIALLHLGHAENILWSWQLTQVIPTVAACAILLVLVSSRAAISPVATVVAGLSVLLLPLNGLNGIIYAPILAAWLGYRALIQWHARQTAASSLFLLGCTLSSLVLTALYFVGYERPTWAPEPAGAGIWLLTTIKFFALGFGPVATSAWALFIMGALLVLASGLALTLWHTRRGESERARAAGLLAFLVAIVIFALGIGWGRAAAIPLFGNWPLRYSLFAVPLLCAGFFIWELYGAVKWRGWVQGALLTIVCLALPINTSRGLSWMAWYQDRDGGLEQDLYAGVPAAQLAERHRMALYHSMAPAQLAAYMRMLRDAGYTPFSRMARDGQTTPQVGATRLDTEIPVVMFQPTADAPLVKQDIRYTAIEATDVTLIWGLDGWAVAPEAWRPQGTELRPAGPKKARLMHTPMKRQAGAFQVTVTAPAGTTIDFGFLRVTRRGSVTGEPTWDGGYQARPLQDGMQDIRQSQPDRSVAMLVRELAEMRDHGMYYLAGIGTFLASWLSLFIFLPLLKE